MYKSFVLVTVVFLFSSCIEAQKNYSLEFSGGIISPISSQKGLIGSVKFFYNHTDNFSLYTNVGYGFWDVNHTGDEENHVIVPVYLGGRFYFNRNKPIEAYLESELGIDLLKYTRYEMLVIKTQDKHEYKFLRDYNSRSVNKKAVLGFGVGFGFVHLLTNGVNLTLGFKVNVLNNYYNYYNLYVDEILVIKTVSAGFNCEI